MKLRPPPWRMRWSIYDLKGIDDSWSLTTPWYKRKMGRTTKLKYFQKYDIVQHYRDSGCEYEREAKVYSFLFNYICRKCFNIFVFRYKIVYYYLKMNVKNQALLNVKY